MDVVERKRWRRRGVGGACEVCEVWQRNATQRNATSAGAHGGSESAGETRRDEDETQKVGKSNADEE